MTKESRKYKFIESESYQEYKKHKDKDKIIEEDDYSKNNDTISFYEVDPNILDENIVIELSKDDDKEDRHIREDRIENIEDSNISLLSNSINIIEEEGDDKIEMVIESNEGNERVESQVIDDSNQLIDGNYKQIENDKNKIEMIEDTYDNIRNTNDIDSIRNTENIDSIRNTENIDSIRNTGDIDNIRNTPIINNIRNTSVLSNSSSSVKHLKDLRTSQSDSSESSSGLDDPPVNQLDRGCMMDTLFLHKLAKIVLFKKKLAEKKLAVDEKPPIKKKGRNKLKKVEIINIDNLNTVSIRETSSINTGNMNLFLDSKPRKSEAIQDIATDLRYLHFLKKVCGLGKSAAVKYISNQQKWLADRNKKNKAEVPEKRLFTYENDGDSIIIRNTEDNINKSSKNKPRGRPVKVSTVKYEPITKINTLKGIKDCYTPPFDMSMFEYIVYKYGCDFTKLSTALGLSVADSILAYYLHGTGKQRMSQALLETIVQNDWANEEDRNLFVENFKRHGRKFSKYQIGRTEKDLRVFCRYYIKKGMPGFWNEEERRIFAEAYKEHKKNWEKLSEAMRNKSIQEIKIYYGEYFKKSLLKGEPRNNKKIKGMNEGEDS